MAIIDETTAPTPTPTPAVGAHRIRRIVRHEADCLKEKIANINAIVALHGRSAISTELGADASELLTIYNGMVTLAELMDTNYTADPLPN